VPSSRASVSDLRRVFAPDLIITARKISLALGYLPKHTEHDGGFVARENGFGRRSRSLTPGTQSPQRTVS
jgi:hypothetical protein